DTGHALHLGDQVPTLNAPHCRAVRMSPINHKVLIVLDLLESAFGTLDMPEPLIRSAEGSIDTAVTGAFPKRVAAVELRCRKLKNLVGFLPAECGETPEEQRLRIRT